MYPHSHSRRFFRGKAPVTNQQQLLAALRSGRLSPRPSDLTDQQLFQYLRRWRVLNTRKRMTEDVKFQNLAGVVD